MYTNPPITMFTKKNSISTQEIYTTTPSKNSKSKTKKVVLNEMLTFVQNKLQTMDPEALVMVCTAIFSWSDIEDAEKILRKLSKDARVRCKEDFDLYDIIEIVKAFDHENGPIFVARDLDKLPKAEATSVLLKENHNLEKENKMLKESIASMDQFLSRVAETTRKQKIYIAKHDYDADDKDEVSIRGGDIISIVEEEEDGWMLGKVLRTGKSGMFPVNYVVEFNKVESHYYEYVQ